MATTFQLTMLGNLWSDQWYGPYPDLDGSSGYRIDITFALVSSSATVVISPSSAYNDPNKITFSNIGKTMTFQPPAAWKAYVSSSSNFLFGHVWVFPSNSSFDSSSDSYMTFHLPAADMPSFTGINLTRIDNGVPAAWNKYLANKSQVKITLTGVAGIYGSTISTRKIDMGVPGYTAITVYADEYTFPMTLPGGQLTINVTITDSRGRSVTKSGTITVYPYTLPSIVARSESRTNSNGTPNILGDTLSATCTYTYDEQGGMNTISAGLTWCVSGGVPSAPVPIENGVPALFGNGAVYPNVAYVITYTVTDLLGSVAAMTVVVDSLKIALEFLSGGLGAAFGVPATQSNTLDVAWDILARTGTLRTPQNIPLIIQAGGANAMRIDPGGAVTIRGTLTQNGSP